MKEQLAVAERVVVSGAGFLGLEIVSVARQMGKDVVVLDSLELPMMRPFGMPARAGGSAQTGRTRAARPGYAGKPRAWPLVVATRRRHGPDGPYQHQCLRAPDRGGWLTC